MRKNYSILLLFFLTNCSQYPIEKIDYYSDGTLKTRSITLDYKGNQNVQHYNEKGELSYEFIWTNKYKDGLYKSYFENKKIKEIYKMSNGEYTGKAERFYQTGEIQSIGLFENDKMINSKSYDKLGILYSELIGFNQEILYQYYKDTSIYEIHHVTRVYDKDGIIKTFEDDSTFYYSNDKKLLLKIIKKPDKVEIEKYSTIENVMVTSIIKNKTELDEIKNELIGKDSLNLFYQLKTQ